MLKPGRYWCVSSLTQAKRSYWCPFLVCPDVQLWVGCAKTIGLGLCLKCIILCISKPGADKWHCLEQDSSLLGSHRSWQGDFVPFLVRAEPWQRISVLPWPLLFQASPVYQDSVQNLLIYCMHWFFSCFLFQQECINFPDFPASYSSSRQKWEQEIQQNALWSTGPLVCLGGTYLTPACENNVVFAGNVLMKAGMMHLTPCSFSEG